MCFQQLNLHSALLRLLLDDGAPDVTHLAVLHHSGRTIRGAHARILYMIFWFYEKIFREIEVLLLISIIITDNYILS